MKKEKYFKGSTNSILLSHTFKEHEEKDDEMIGQIIFKKFQIKKKFGKTSTIDIYEGISKEDNKQVLIKIENQNQNKLYLEKEAYNLYSFKNFGIPELIKFGKRKDSMVLIEAKKGPTLYDLFLKNNRQFSLNEICLIGIQCIERLKWIHSQNYIHRNIKPDNFSIGIEDPHVIYLQNFYLSQKYKSSKTNQHSKFIFTKEIVGTERYGSINALRGLSQSRRDDLESLCYMLFYFFLGKLPWQGIKADNEGQKLEKILNMKKNFKIANYSQIPKHFGTLFTYVKSLKFVQEPKYQMMIRLLQNIREENECYNNQNFFWIIDKSCCPGANIKIKKEGFRERLLNKIQGNKKPRTDIFIKKSANISDVNIINLGKGYINEELEKDDFEEDEQEGNEEDQKEESEEEEKKKENNDNQNIEENVLDKSDSSDGTKIYKLPGEIESVIKKDIMTDPELSNIDEIKYKNSTNQSNNCQIQVSENYNITHFKAIKEEPIYENDSEYGGENLENLNENQLQIIEEENNFKSIIAKMKNIGKSSLGNTNIKQESTKESIHFNEMQNYSKGNISNGSVLIVKNNSKKEEKEEIKNKQPESNDKDKNINRANSIDYKFAKPKNYNDNNNVSAKNNKRHGSITKTKKGCIIF